MIKQTIAPCGTPGFTKTPAFWPGLHPTMKDGYFGGQTLIQANGHLWSWADRWGRWVSYCGINEVTEPKPHDRDRPRCQRCKECPAKRRTGRPADPRTATPCFD